MIRIFFGFHLFILTTIEPGNCLIMKYITLLLAFFLVNMYRFDFQLNGMICN